MTRPMEWLAALRDHPDRPPVTQRMVLVSLAQRMDWSTGCGYASTGTLAADADCAERTVRSATGWARGQSMLKQTRRGHRRGDGRVIASEWALCLPVSTGSPVPVEDTSRDISTGKSGSLNRQMKPSQPAATAPPSRTKFLQELSSSAFVGAAGARPTQATPDDVWAVLKCWACGEDFPAGELHPEDISYAMRGQLLCLRCENLTDEELRAVRGER